MRKLLLLITALLTLGASGAWAYETVKIADKANLPTTYGLFTGTTLFTTNGSSGLAGVTITAPESGIVLGSGYVNASYGNCFSIITSAASTNYQINLAVPSGYTIVGYKLGASASSASYKHTLTAADGTTSVLVNSYGYEGDFNYLNVSNVNAQTTHFTISTANGGSTCYFAYIEVYIHDNSQTYVDVTYKLYESDGITEVTSSTIEQQANSNVSIPSSLKSVVSPYEANDYDYATTGTIGTENCTITVTRTLKSDTYAPSLQSGYNLSVGDKATTMTPATSAGDNDHWYLVTQNRVENTTYGEYTPIYDVSTYGSVSRASTSVTNETLHNTAIDGSEQYLVRFIETSSGSGLYYMQFANGNYITSDLKSAQTANNAGTFAFYKVTSGDNGTDYTFGWNVESNSGSRVDNNGVGKALATWKSGVNDGSSKNNIWTIYPVEFVNTVEISYTLTDANNATYSGTYRAAWDGDNTPAPTLPGAYGATFSQKVFSNASGYTFTAIIDFGFPVSSNSVNNPTAIQSALGSSLWYAKDGKVIADNAANTTVYDIYADNYRWYIYPVFDNGTFSFKLYNVGAAKYIPSNPSTSSNTATTLTDEAASAGAFQFAHYSQGNGFYDATNSKFLTINSSGKAQNIWLWGGYGSGTHQGSVMSFPALTVVSVSDEFATLKNATKFDILEGSTVVGPSEFAAPAEINAAIDAAQKVADNDEAKLAFIQGSNGAMIKNYLTQVDTYGDLANIQITMSKEYGTMILPCPATRISGLDIYSCSAQDNGVLTLTPVAGDYAFNKPYIIHATEGSKYTIIGWDKESTATHTDGWLTGVLNSDTEIPSDSYMLATNKSTGVQAFYKVSGSGVKCAINKCYLTVPSAGVKAFYFDEDGKTTSIEEIFGGEAEQGAIYNLAGQRLQKLQKGINIINGKKIIK